MPPSARPRPSVALCGGTLRFRTELASGHWRDLRRESGNMGIWRARPQAGPKAGPRTTRRKSSGRRLRRGSAAGLLLLGIAAILFAVPSALSSGATPTITSDLPDYNPGQQVTLTGSNWDPAGGPVHIVVNDNVGQTWQYTG